MIRALGVLAFLMLVGVAAPAAAHPFGAPPAARLAAQGHQVSLTWTAASDDWSALAGQLGVLPRSQAFQTNADGQVEQVDGETVPANLSGSTELAGYVTRNLVVLQDDTPCQTVDVTSADVVERGVTVGYLCPRPVRVVTAQSTMLHDVHPAYRTLVRTEHNDATLLTAQRPAARLNLAGGVAGPTPATRFDASAGGLEARLLDAFDRAANAGLGALAVVVALGAGAFHALAPGHGKSVAAAAMLAGQGRLRHAGVLGLTVAAMHTASAAAVAVALVVADSAQWLAAVTGWLSVGAGVAVAGVGVLLLRRTRVRGHAHRIPGRTLASLGLFAGLLPSPTMLLLLVAGMLSGRAVFALVVVSAFGIGMAATITAAGASAGTIASRARNRGGLGARLGNTSPVLGATGVTLAGVVYAANGARTLL